MEHFLHLADLRGKNRETRNKNSFFKPLLGLLSGLLFLLPTVETKAQQSKLDCSTTSIPWVNGTTPAFTVTRTRSTTGLATWSAGTSNVIDNNLTNYATGNIVSGSLILSVQDANNVYNAGNFAGFALSNGLVNLSVLGDITINTYNGATLQETSSAASLLGLGTSITGVYEVGFYTNKPFNKIELVISSVLLGSYNVYYPVLKGTGTCAGPVLACNKNTRLSFPAYPVVINPVNTNVTGLLALAAISNADFATDSISTNYASINTILGVAGSAALSVREVDSNYAAGTFAGFDIENVTLLSLSLLNNLTIKTYKDGVFREQQSGSGLILGATVLNTSGRQIVGFATTLDFDEVQIVVNQDALLAVSLGETRIYSAVFKKLCAGPALACNIPTIITDETYPVLLNPQHTGFTGTACVACTIDGIGNLLDTISTNSTNINLTVGALSNGQIAVKDEITDYPAGTFAGFDIENTALLNVGVLANVQVNTFRNGVAKQTISGNSLLVAVPSSLITANGRMTLGIIADSSFDEVQLSLDQPVGVNLGSTKVYSAIFERFCGSAIACNATTWLNSPAQSVIIDQQQTGTTGAVCALCAVNNPGNAVSASTTDFAQIITATGVISSSSIAVRDAGNTYPAGTIAGFAVQDPNNFLQVSLFKTITLSTYLRGVIQETKSSGELLNLSAVLPLITTGNGVYNVSLASTLPFDEVKISLSPIVGVIPILNVYGAFVDTRAVDPATTPGFVCMRAPNAVNDNSGTPKDVILNGNLRTNDTDPQGSTLTYNTTPAVAPLHGNVTINPAGTFTYQPAAGYVGNDSFTYTVCNSYSLCSNAVSYISVIPTRVSDGPNNAPLAQTDISQTIMNVPVSGNARNNDTDPDGDSLFYTVVSAPKHGQLVLNNLGSYVYTPDSSYVGNDTATVQVCDNRTPALCATSSLIVMVEIDNGRVNFAPFAQNDLVNTIPSTAVSGNVLSNDSDPDGDAITASLIGTVPPSAGTLTLNANGSFVFNPANGYIGTVTVPYKVCDASLCDTATLTIVVQAYIGPDYTPNIVIDALSFPTANVTKDFVVNVSELKNKINAGAVVVRIFKASAFNTTILPTTTIANVNGATLVGNSNWDITQNAFVITCTLKAGRTLIGFSTSAIGLTVARKPGVPVNTTQNVTVNLGDGSGGDSENTNNQYSISITAQ